MRELPAADLTHVLDHTRHVWDDYRGAKIFLTGGSGFVGSWLLETLLHANTTLGLGISVTVLVRDRDAFTSRLPHLAAAKGVRLHVGDVRIVDPPTHAFTHFVHCASAATPRMNAEQPGEVLDLIEKGSLRMIEEAETGDGARFLQMSSGSVYGPQPADLPLMAEDYAGRASVDDKSHRFACAKLDAERRGKQSVKKGVKFVAARAFALVGPRLPLDGQFALGNFLGDALAGREIDITGDGTPIRSWMHAADLAAWSWTILARGTPGTSYNVGSEEAFSLWDAAHRVAALATPPVPVVRAALPPSDGLVSRYVPSVALARESLGLDVWIPFDEALRRTWEWYRA